MAREEKTIDSLNLIERGWDDVQAQKRGEYKKLPPGAYVCRIENAKFVLNKDGIPQVVCDIDINEGEFSKFFTQRLGFTGSWDFNAQFKRNAYAADGKVAPAFKAFLTVLREQNPSATFTLASLKPSDFVGMICGFVFCEREYTKNGETRIATEVRYACTVDEVRAGTVEIPPISRSTEQNRPDKKNDFFAGTPVDDKDIPDFGVNSDGADVPF